MNDLIKRRKEIDDEFEELYEAESDLNNTKANMTIATVGKLLKKFNEAVGDLVEILSKKDNYDADLKGVIESTISQVADKFSQIQPPTINVSPQLKFDIQPLQSIASKISEQNASLMDLIGKFNNNQNEGLYRLISSLVEKQNNFLDREFKRIDNTPELKSISEGVNKNNRVQKIVFNRGGTFNQIIDADIIYKDKK